MSNRQLASTAIDPADMPQRVLTGGATMPAVGFGTFGSDRVSPANVAVAVVGAIGAGYRHIDCAAVYSNEREIGGALRLAAARGVPREDLWITSKLWNDMHGDGDVAVACERSLRHLGLEYLDLYLVHWPFPNHHQPGCDGASRLADAKPYIHDRYVRTWRQMERLVERGLVRHIGTSNMTIPKLKLLLQDASIRPAANEMELHPHFQQPALYDFVRSHGIQPIGYCPLGSPNRPDRDRTVADSSPLLDSTIAEIARRHDAHPAIVCLKWAAQRGQIPIPFSTNPEHYVANLRAVVENPLTAAEMETMSRVDRNCRLIKGQVFLWKRDQSWEDLWDPSGEITPP